MAELNVVKKRKSPLPWILLALLLLGLIAYLFLRNSAATPDDNGVRQDSTISYDSSGQNAP
jgi:F0F1-type ATP synthase assembly protein I